MLLRLRSSMVRLGRTAGAAAAVGLVVAIVIACLGRRSSPDLPPAALAGGRPAEQERSPWHELRERLLDLPRDQPGVRVIVLGGALLIAIAGSLIGFGQSLPQATLGVQTGQGFQAVTASSGVIVFGVVCTVVAWALVISGLFLARWQVRLAGLALLAAGAAAERHEMGGLSLFTGVSGLVAIAGILLVGLLTVTADWRTQLGRKSLEGI